MTTGGGAKCWGSNGSGQLGDGTGTNRVTPVAVVGLTSGVSAISAGGYHTCAVTTGGAAKCWGSNAQDQIGDGTRSNGSVSPVSVVGLGSGVAAVSAGGYHTCALMTDGKGNCWGNNSRGELGNGWTPSRVTPGNVLNLSIGVLGVSAGRAHTCALTTGGGTKCWGYNYSGQLGDGTQNDRSAAVDVSGLTSGVVEITVALEHSCVLTTGGGAKCWGSNSSGQLGDGTTAGRLTPVSVTGLASGVTAISADGFHTCALTTSGGAKCWGYNSYGQLGDGTVTNRPAPVDVVGLSSGVSAVSTGLAHACALMTGGGVKCWGDNGSGQLGDGTGTSRMTPVAVVGLTSGVSAISAGGYHTCALTTAGEVKCWGAGGYVGDGTTTTRSTPVGVVGGVSAVSAGEGHTCAVLTSGGAKCWGSNAYFKLGDGTSTTRLTPTDVVALGSGVTSVSAGGSHTCATIAGGGLKCWGRNYDGQLGDGYWGPTRREPVEVIGSGGYSISGTAAGLGGSSGSIRLVNVASPASILQTVSWDRATGAYTIGGLPEGQYLLYPSFGAFPAPTGRPR